MYGLLLSAIYSIIGWVIARVVARVIIVGLTYFMFYEILGTLINKLMPIQADNLTQALNSFDANMIYFLRAFAVDQGLPMIVSAHTTAFMIRRLPFVG